MKIIKIKLIPEWILDSSKCKAKENYDGNFHVPNSFENGYIEGNWQLHYYDDGKVALWEWNDDGNSILLLNNISKNTICLLLNLNNGVNNEA